MNAVVATPAVEAKGTESQVIEAHGARIPVIGLGTWNLRGRSCAGLVERLSENFAIFDFLLSETEMAEIAGPARRDGRIVDYAYSGSPNWD
jgi:diketogulonate reductase-like aldo/keto reductase